MKDKNHRMLVETGEEITTKISSREEKGVAGQGSLRAGRITGPGKTKPTALQEW